jgi:membrane protein implicated in regulation of membrane protease activity
MLNGAVSSSSLIGRVGTVSETVRGGELPGEVRIVVEGLPHHYLAYCTEQLPVGQQVLVINNRGSRKLDVKPWAHTDFGAAGFIDPDERL